MSTDTLQKLKEIAEAKLHRSDGWTTLFDREIKREKKLL